MVVQLNVPVVREFMDKNDLSEPAMAKRMNIDYPFLYRVLRGQKGIGPVFITSLIQVTGYPYDSLFLTEPLSTGIDDVENKDRKGVS